MQSEHEQIQSAIASAGEQFAKVYHPTERAFPLLTIYPIANGQMMMLGAPGLSKREWLAGLAIQSLIAEPGSTATVEATAANACAYADALLIELAKPAKPKGSEPPCSQL